MQRSRTILLLGSNDLAALELCRSLGRAGHRVAILRLSRQRTPADHSRFCSESLYLGSPESGVGEYVAALKELLRSRRYDYLIPIQDLACELTYSEYDAISSLTRVVGPGPASYARARNGFEALAVAEAAGLARPRTVLVKRGHAPPPAFLPCFVKPVLSGAIIDGEPQRFSVRKVDSLDELDAKLRDDLPRVDVMLQEPVAGAGVGLCLCAIDGDVLGASITLHLHEPHRGGASYRKTGEITPRALAIIQSVARQLSWTGFLTIECRETKDCVWVVKLRCHPWASISHPIFSGVDLPRLLIDALEAQRGPRIATPTRSVFTRNLRTDVGWLVRQVRGGAGPKAIAPWIVSFWRVLAGRERLDVERIDDPLPAIRQFDVRIRSVCERVWLQLRGGLRPAELAPVASALSRTSSLLVVCKGNINRSIVAEQLFKARGFTRVRSAGLLAMPGRRPSKYAEAFLASRLGIDISGLRSRSVPGALKELGAADAVLCFERTQALELAQRFPQLRGKIALFAEFARDREGPRQIADPHGAAPETYLACFRRIEKLVDEIIRLVPG